LVLAVLTFQEYFEIRGELIQIIVTEGEKTFCRLAAVLAIASIAVASRPM
jgi:hypothetical protein